MRLAFMGTPDFAARALGEILAAGHEIAAVYTRAPQPSGRGMALHDSAVATLARQHGLIVRTPKSLKQPAEQAAFQALDLDAAVVVAYGLILPRPILDAPRLGCFNLHASLLPRWRGAAPIQRAIMAGDAATGVQVMRMEEGLDTGPILLSEATPIRPDDTAGTLHDRLAHIGADLLVRVLSALSRDAVVETRQSDEGVVYAAKISTDEARIDWSRPAAEVDRQIRGLSPFPGAWFEAPAAKGAQRVKALMSAVRTGSGPPGEILSVGDALLVACGSGAVALTRLQRAGRGAQSAEDFLRGFPLKPGDCLPLRASDPISG